VNWQSIWDGINAYPPKTGEALLMWLLKSIGAFIHSLTPYVPEIAGLCFMGCALAMIATADVGKWLGKAMVITVAAIAWLTIWG
jgi:hypothetical protein